MAEKKDHFDDFIARTKVAIKRVHETNLERVRRKYAKAPKLRIKWVNRYFLNNEESMKRIKNAYANKDNNPMEFVFCILETRRILSLCSAEMKDKDFREASQKLKQYLEALVDMQEIRSRFYEYQNNIENDIYFGNNEIAEETWTWLLSKNSMLIDDVLTSVFEGTLVSQEARGKRVELEEEEEMMKAFMPEELLLE